MKLLPLLLVLLVSGCICPPDFWEGPWPPWCEKPSAPEPAGVQESNATPGQTQEEQVQTPEKITPSPVPIYAKDVLWEPEDPADLVMTPTVVGFGWNLDSDPRPVNAAHERGVEFIASISLWNHDRWRTVDDLPKELSTAYVVDFDGKLVYNQDMVYLNLMDPAFRNWLKEFVKREIDLGVDGFVVDEVEGAASAVWMGVGFDKYSLNGFREYLKNKYTTAELKASGVENIESFDYRKFLIDNGYRQLYESGKYKQVPFGADYYDFLRMETTDFIKELIEYARGYAATKGRKIKITANYDPLYTTTDSDLNDYLDYYTYEHSYLYNPWRNEAPNKHIPYGVPATASIKYARGVGKFSTVLMNIYDYGELAKTGEPAATELVKHFFAEAYANRGYFVYFDLGQEFVGNKFTADHSRLRKYYSFIRENPDVLNNLHYNPQVAIIHPPAVKSDFGPVDNGRGASMILSTANIPYDVIDIEKLSDKYKVVLASGYAWSDTQLDKLISFGEDGGVIIAFDSRFAEFDENFEQADRQQISALKTPGEHALGAGEFIFYDQFVARDYYTSLDADAYSEISGTVGKYVDANAAPENVQVIPYLNADNNLVIHLLNYEFKNGDFATKSNFPVSVELPAGVQTDGKQLRLLDPDTNTTRTIPFTTNRNKILFNTPSLHVWGVLILE